MSRKSVCITVILSASLLLSACVPSAVTPAPEANMPNPASVFCEEHGGKVELRQDASGGVAGLCVFPDGSECDEWAYYRGECSPGQGAATSTVAAEAAAVEPAALSTPLTIDPADYQGWWTYSHPIYGFTLRLPADWIASDITSGGPLMNGHLLTLQSQDTAAEGLTLRMAFRRAGEETLLWPTGVGEGEFVPQGTLDVAGSPARRTAFVCPTGQVNSLWYQGEDGPNIRRGELEFSFIFGYTGVYCQERYSLGGKVQRVGEMIIASLEAP